MWYFGLFVATGIVVYFVNKYFGMIPAIVIAVVPLALVVNGWVAEWEDRRPGGFLNPNGEKDDDGDQLG
jgi:hypothetical protein